MMIGWLIKDIWSHLYLPIHFLLSVRWWKQPISVLEISPPITVQSDVSCSDTLKILGSEAIDQMPVVDKNGYISYSTI